jgi:hypothetical protein
MLATTHQGCVPDDQVEDLLAIFSWARNGEALARILWRAATTGPVPAKRKLQAVQLARYPVPSGP